jgi:hypothetical protein
MTVNPEQIAEAFINKQPYYDGKYIVAHRDHFFDAVSVIGVDVDADMDRFFGRPILYMAVPRESSEGRSILVTIDPRGVEDVEVFNAVFKRLKDIIGVEMSAVKMADRVGIAIKGFKYVFMEHYVMTKMIDRRGVRILGYVKRFAPLNSCHECVDISERIKELQNRLNYEVRELKDILYHLDLRKLREIFAKTGLSPHQVREILSWAESMARRDIVIDGVGIYIGSDNPRTLLSRYKNMLNKISEIVAKIKEEIVFEKLLS